MSSESTKIRTQMLVLKCQRGEEAAFGELISLWEKPLYYYIRRLVASEEDAFDVLQDVWMKVFGNIRQVRNPESVTVWLYRIARNTAFNSWRRKVKTEPLDETVENLPDDEPDVTENLASAQDAEAIHRALEKIPTDQREALTLFFLEEFTIQEISEVTGAPEGTVKSRLHQRKRKLKKILKKEDFSHV